MLRRLSIMANAPTHGSRQWWWLASWFLAALGLWRKARHFHPLWHPRTAHSNMIKHGFLVSFWMVSFLRYCIVECPTTCSLQHASAVSPKLLLCSPGIWELYTEGKVGPRLTAETLGARWDTDVATGRLASCQRISLSDLGTGGCPADPHVGLTK